MGVTWMFSLVVGIATLATAQDVSQATQNQPDASPQIKHAEKEKHGGLFSKKPKVVLSPEEEAAHKAAIQSQIDALPQQGPPLMDENGKQMLNPDAQPMFHPAPKPLLDKHGQPGLDEQGKLLLQSKDNLGYDAHGKKLKAAKEKEPKKVPVTIEKGTLTVDGWTGKARLNYEIGDLKYLYLYAPEIGNTVVSTLPFPGATEQKNAFNGQNLTVTVSEHTLQLFSEKPLLHQKKPAPAYVRVDREYRMDSSFPVMGFGTLRKPPYAWPGSKESTSKAPALPKGITPKIATKPGSVPPRPQNP